MELTRGKPLNTVVVTLCLTNRKRNCKTPISSLYERASLDNKKAQKLGTRSGNVRTIVWIHLLSLLIKSDLLACVESDFFSFEKVSARVNKMFSSDVLSILKLLNDVKHQTYFKKSLNSGGSFALLNFTANFLCNVSPSISVCCRRPYVLPVVNQ